MVSFNGRMSDEYSNELPFASLVHANSIPAAWKHD
jgi:hypothetical protein